MTPHPPADDQAGHGRGGERLPGEVGEAVDTPGGCTVGMGEFTDDPRTDPETLCLCALLWAPAGPARRVADVLRAEDFYVPV